RLRLAVTLLVLQYRCKNCQAIPSPLFFIHLNAVVDISIWEHLLICIHNWVNKLSEERPLTLCYILFCCLCVYYWKGQLAALCLSIDFYFYDYFGHNKLLKTNLNTVYSPPRACYCVFIALPIPKHRLSC